MTVMVEVDKNAQVYSLESNGTKVTGFCPEFTYNLSLSTFVTFNKILTSQPGFPEGLLH